MVGFRPLSRVGGPTLMVDLGPVRPWDSALQDATCDWPGGRVPLDRTRWIRVHFCFISTLIKRGSHYVHVSAKRVRVLETTGDKRSTG